MLQVGLAGLAGLSVGRGLQRPAARAQGAGGIGEQRLSDGLHVLRAGPTNVLAQTGRDGALLVDGGAARAAEALLDAVNGLSGGGTVHTLFNTHWHPEQTGLNERLGRAGAAIIAHENTRLWLTTDITYPWDGQHFEPLPEVGQPNTTFYDEGELESGVRYGHLRHAAHTDGDLYVYFPEADVLAVGDTVHAAEWPFIDWWTGGWIGGMVGNLELLLALAGPETRVVPARGPILGRADLETQFEMYNVVYSRLAGLLNDGMGPDEAVAARPTEEFDARMGPPDAFVRQAFKSLWAYLSPDA